jgi:hypothetical protein
MLKSCDYCRHRKKRCVLPANLAGVRTRCDDCEHLNIACEFSRRNASLKRQKTSQHIASRVSSSIPKDRRFSSAETTAVGATDCQAQQADTNSVAEKIILRDDELDDGGYPLSIADEYYKNVRLLAPFLPDEMLAGEDVSHNLVLQYCIQLASCLSLQRLHDRRALPATSQINRNLETILSGRQMSLSEAAGILLLFLRLDLDEAIVKQV